MKKFHEFARPSGKAGWKNEIWLFLDPSVLLFFSPPQSMPVLKNKSEVEQGLQRAPYDKRASRRFAEKPWFVLKKGFGESLALEKPMAASIQRKIEKIGKKRFLKTG